MEDGTLMLKNEFGKEEPFQPLDMIHEKDHDYLVAVSLLEESEGGVAVFELKGEEEEDMYAIVTDDELGERIFTKFVKAHPELEFEE